MADRTVRVRFGAETKAFLTDLAAAQQGVNDLDGALDNSEGSVKSFSDRMTGVSEGLDGASSQLSALSGGLSGLGAQFGLPTEKAAAMAQNFSDITDGIANGLIPAFQSGAENIKKLSEFAKTNTIVTKAQAAAQKALNLVMKQNPIGLVIVAVTLLIAGFIALYKNSETFRSAVQKLGEVFKSVFGKIKSIAVDVFNWIKDHWKLILGILTGPIGLAVVAITGNFDKIKGAASKMIDGIKSLFSKVKGYIVAPFQAAVNAVKSAWNSTVGGKGIHIPSIGIGPFKTPGVDFSIPYLANGGRITGPSIVGERGPEMFVPNGTGRIVPNNQLNGGGGTTVIQFVVDGKVITESVYSGLLEKQRRGGALKFGSTN